MMAKKKSKPTQPKKGSTKNKESNKLAIHDVEKNEIIPSEEINGLAEQFQTKLDLDDKPAEVKVVDSDLKNNNLTPGKSEDRLDQETAPLLSFPASASSIRGEEAKDLEEEVEVGLARKVVPLKHPLEHTWTLWWFNNKSKSWQAEEITSFSTIEDFWSAYNWIQPASQLGVNCDYAVFKKGIQPDWEDPNNAQGGRWVAERNNIKDMDRFWLETLFMLIGEHTQPYCNLINGAVVQKKKGKFRLAVWLKDASKWSDRGIIFIGHHLRRQFNIVDSDLMDFRVHSVEQKRPVGRSGGKV